MTDDERVRVGAAKAPSPLRFRRRSELWRDKSAAARSYGGQDGETRARLRSEATARSAGAPQAALILDTGCRPHFRAEGDELVCPRKLRAAFKHPSGWAPVRSRCVTGAQRRMKKALQIRMEPAFLLESQGPWTMTDEIRRVQKNPGLFHVRWQWKNRLLRLSRLARTLAG